MIVNIKRAVLALPVAVLFLAVAPTANAVPVNFSFEGTVDFTLIGLGANPFNLATGDPVMVSGVFDDAALTAGTGTIDFNVAGNSFTWILGDTTFTEADAFAATMDLLAGALTDFGYLILGSPGGVNFGGLSFSIATNPSAFSVSGDFDPDSFQIERNEIPEPASLALLAVGLAGMAGLRRRRRAR